MAYNILLIVLGCHIKHLLTDRINTAIKFAEDGSYTHVDWFFSGGIKHPELDTTSEAKKMIEQVYSSTTDEERNNWSFIEDTWSTNTADNFFMVKKLIDEDTEKYEKVYVVTSNFHHKRAKMFADKIIESNEFEWILGSLDDYNLRYMEPLHIKNVDTDIKKSFDRFKFVM